MVNDTSAKNSGILGSVITGLGALIIVITETVFVVSNWHWISGFPSLPHAVFEYFTPLMMGVMAMVAALFRLRAVALGALAVLSYSYVGFLVYAATAMGFDYFINMFLSGRFGIATALSLILLTVGLVLMWRATNARIAARAVHGPLATPADSAVTSSEVGWQRDPFIS